MDGKFMQELNLNVVGIPAGQRYIAIRDQIKKIMLELNQTVEAHLQNYLEKSNLTKEELAKTHTVVQWVEQSGYDCYLCVKILKNEDVDSFVPPTPPNYRINLKPDEFFLQAKFDLNHKCLF